MSFDPDTERRIDEALELANRRRRLRIVDHHPWEAPPDRGLPRRFHVTRWMVLRIVGAFLALEVVRQASRLSGWDRLGLIVAALVILFVSLGRPPE